MRTAEVTQLLGVSRQAVGQLVEAGKFTATKDDKGSLVYDRAEVEAYEAARAAARHRKDAERDERVALGVARHVEASVARHQSVFEGSLLDAIEQRETAKLTEQIAELKAAVDHLTFRLGALDQLRADEREDVRALKKRADTTDTWLAVFGGAEVASLLLDPRVREKIREVFATLTSTPSADASAPL